MEFTVSETNKGTLYTTHLCTAFIEIFNMGRRKRYEFDIKNLYAIENIFFFFFAQMKEKISANDMSKSANENRRW